jgi:hypothetical protein
VLTGASAPTISRRRLSKSSLRAVFMWGSKIQW